jgi:predicted deacylase
MIERRTLSVPGLDLDLPYFDIQGRGDGPRLTVVAGVHGTEYTSIAAVRAFVRGVNPDEVTGSITLVPVVNVPAFWARSPFVVPVDGENLNRAFPGDPDGGYTQKLAHHVFTSFVVGADYLVDLHAGDLPEALEPFTIFEESPVEAASRELALAYGAGHMVRQAAVARTVAGSSCAAAADAGIPAIIAESGQNGLVDRAAVDQHLAGLTNIARTVGVLAGDPAPMPEPRFHEGWHWLRTDRAGWWQPAVTTGEAVRTGALLGTMSDVWGEVFAEVTAPEAGTPLFLTTSPAVSADGLLLGLARD